MPHRFPILSEDSADKVPSLTMEIIFRLKVKDAMMTSLWTATKKHTFREIQTVMRDNEISGVPVLDDNRLVGIVSVSDIINALDSGHIEEPIEAYMSKQLIVLEDDMPLSFAVSYYNKYPYRRFPVINKNKEFVGILTTKDVLTAILNEMNNEINILENQLHHDKVELPNQIIREYIIKQFDFEKAGQASFKLKKLLKEKEVSRKIIRRASVAAYEMEINVAIHSNGGKITFVLEKDSITIITKDTGPGIADVAQAIEEGYSTANDWIRSLGFGAGMGIPNTKRVSDEFKIESEPGKGTIVKSVIYLEETDESQ
ncbi:MAG: CBS domain-containing protein [Spirochaetes bacterium]|nr:CBS domain-containing protein [Spirochaetota bacterium]MBN2772582.1 CBS domain-containing protein [Spirochaetota bacterium]HRX15467.1 CBS domain-containing protein [Spirochaetota bacterium]